jgi:hypothetical protein
LIPLPGGRSRTVGELFQELDATVEGAAADHLEGNVGIAVVDAYPTGASLASQLRVS